jgi:Cytotoxic
LAAGAGYIPPPETLPGFPGAERVRPKTRVAGRRRPRWRDPDGNIYEWDLQHGTVERYNRRGEHTGEFDHMSGRQIGEAVPGRRVEP